MIIGESDQLLSESNYYESPQKFEVLKRKISNENEECDSLNSFVDRTTSKSFENKSSGKMHYVDSVEEYQTYQTTEIHQDGDQSYINLTVLTPTTLDQYDKGQSNHQQITNFNMQRDGIKPTTISASKFEVRQYQQHQTTGKQLTTGKRRDKRSQIHLTCIHACIMQSSIAAPFSRCPSEQFHG